MKGMYATLVKREVWEPRWLWLAPLAAAGLMIGVTLIKALNAKPGVPVGIDFKGMSVIAYSLYMLKMQLSVVAAIVATIYLLDCLYAERKDRSILFWKSLPVSDFQTVTSKLAVALVVLPLCTFALGTLVFPLTYLIGAVFWPEFHGMTGGWNSGDWLRTEWWMLGRVLATLLWHAPIAAWLMLISVISSRSPYFLVGLPLVVLGVGENMLLNTRNVWEFAQRRILPVDSFMEGMQRPDLWIGLAVAAGMLYIVVRARRYRDDT
jgi:ABC-2 type transport system permease protein